MKTIATVLMVLCMSVAASAQTCSMWFGTSASDSTPLTSLEVAPGAEFTVHLYATTTFASDIIDLALGYDRTTGTDIDAVRMDNKITLKMEYDEDAEEYIPAVAKGVVLSTYYPNPMVMNETGFSGTGIHPYGLEIVQDRAGTRSAYASKLIASITLVNSGNAMNYPVTLWDDGSSYSATSLIGYTLGDVWVRPGAQTLMINPVPEPVSVSLLAMGGLALLRRKFA